MIVLTIRTDKPEAEIGLFKAGQSLIYKKWTAHRRLAETIHNRLEEILDKSSISYGDIEGLVCFKGPGSFTGLRIGFSAANALAYGLGIPVVSAQGKGWQQRGIKRLSAGENERIALPEYGHPASISKQRK